MFKHKPPDQIALLLSFGYGLALFQRVAFGVIAPSVASGYHLDLTQIADVGSIFFWTLFVVQFPMGLLTDTIGSRRAAIMGCILATLGCAEFAFAPNLGALYGARMVIALGAALVFASMIRYVSFHFKTRSGAAVGHGLFVGNAVCLLAGAPLIGLLGFVSYKVVWIMIGLLYVFMALAMMVWVPETHGHFSIRKALKKAYQETPYVMTSRWTYFGIILVAALPGAYFGFTTQAINRWVNLHSDENVSIGWLLTMSTAGFALGNLLWGWLSDYIDRPLALIVSLLGALGTWSWMMSTGSYGQALLEAFFFVQGIFCAPVALIYALVAEKVDHKYRAGVIGAVSCGLPLGCAVSQNAVGRMPDFAIIFPMCLLACIGLAFVLHYYWKNKNKVHWKNDLLILKK